MFIENSKVLIIGGSSGIGLGIAMTCSDNNAQVTIASRSEDKLKSSFKKLKNCAGYEVVDVLSSESIESLFSRIGKIDHLIVTSGAVTSKKFNELSEEDARLDFDLNFWGKFNVVKLGEPYINKNGSITFISGAFAKRPNSNVFITSISVSAVESMAKTLALSLSPIRVNVISPYVIDTNQVSEGSISEERREFIKATAEKLPSQCVGTPHEIGEAVAMVMSNPYITGSVIAIDGGYTI